MGISQREEGAVVVELFLVDDLESPDVLVRDVHGARRYCPNQFSCHFVST